MGLDGSVITQAQPITKDKSNSISYFNVHIKRVRGLIKTMPSK